MKTAFDHLGNSLPPEPGKAQQLPQGDKASKQMEQMQRRAYLSS